MYKVVKMSRVSKRIPIREETLHKLEDFKRAGETWDDVFQELIKAKQLQNRRELLERTNDDEFVPLDEV